MQRIIVTVAIGIIYGGSAMAGIMHFENPPPGEEGHHNWHWQPPDAERTFENWLDITQPSTNQFSLGNGNSVGQLSTRNGNSNFTDNGALVGRTELGRTRAFLFGEDITQADNFNDLAIHWFNDGSGIQSEFPEGELRYIGVLTADNRYGWIAVIRESIDMRAVAWAYQTEAGVPIRAGEVPAVGGIALFGLFGMTSRRRRHH